MIRLKKVKAGCMLNGFCVKSGFWVGYDEETNQAVASSGWENNGQLAIYRFADGKWLLDWVDDDREHIYPFTTFEQVNYESFDEWFEAEYGEGFSDYEGYLEDVDEQYESFLYDGAPKFSRVL